MSMIYESMHCSVTGAWICSGVIANLSRTAAALHITSPEKFSEHEFNEHRNARETRKSVYLQDRRNGQNEHKIEGGGV